jgi:hypothetical protein
MLALSGLSGTSAGFLLFHRLKLNLSTRRRKLTKLMRQYSQR